MDKARPGGGELVGAQLFLSEECCSCCEPCPGPPLKVVADRPRQWLDLKLINPEFLVTFQTFPGKCELQRFTPAKI